ncbi:MAG: tyrosine-type recombinase/integrase, partial [Candidatus Nanohaloarchaea archaeon]
MNGDIHNRKGRIKSTTTKIKEADHISDYNREILLDFKSYLISQDLSDDRLCRYLYNWYQLTELVNWNLDETSKEGIQVIVEKINKGDFREDLSPHTKAEYKKAIRKLFTDYFASKSHKYQPIGQGYDGEELCDFFSLTVDDENLDREELPTPELAKRFVREANSLRDKAFIMTLWSSAGRIGEVLGLQWKHIRFDTRKGEEIVKLKFEDQKIGGNRKVPLRAGYLYLKQLQESDPRGDDPDAFVFRSTTTDRQMSHNAGCGILNRIRDRIDRKA